MPRPENDREQTPQTKPMPPEVARNPAKLRDKLPEPRSGDEGEIPPTPPQDQKEPREPGTAEPR